ncbi:hypothetical protein [Dongia sp.]|uniref:hypothetical protein n=1 Tax=Dongia sp. TaxID=1977262 RepID=UPI0035AED9E1
MSLEPLDNLVKTGQLKQEPPDQAEFDGLLRSGMNRLKDASNKNLSAEGRFDLAYNAAHALSLAALRWHGYRPDKRYIVFPALQHTLKLAAAQWRVLDKAHNERNSAEYEGYFNVDSRLLDELLRIAQTVSDEVQKLGPVDPS